MTSYTFDATAQPASMFQSESGPEKFSMYQPTTGITSREHSEVNGYKKRLETFKNHWPDWAAVTKESVAKAGMVYIGPDDKVQCDTCRGILYSFDHGDVPIEEHTKHFGLCPFVKQQKYELLLRELAAIETPERASDVQEPREANPNPREAVRGACQHQSTATQQAETAADHITNLPVFNIVRELGYSEEQIKIAFSAALKEVSIEAVNSAVLLDKLYDMDSD